MEQVRKDRDPAQGGVWVIVFHKTNRLPVLFNNHQDHSLVGWVMFGERDWDVDHDVDAEIEDSI